MDKTTVKEENYRKNRDNLEFCLMMALHVSLSSYFKDKTTWNIWGNKQKTKLEDPQSKKKAMVVHRKNWWICVHLCMCYF